jgi:hypothetical protein
MSRFSPSWIALCALHSVSSKVREWSAASTRLKAAWIFVHIAHVIAGSGNSSTACDKHSIVLQAGYDDPAAVFQRFCGLQGSQDPQPMSDTSQGVCPSFHQQTTQRRVQAAAAAAGQRALL